MACLIIGNNRNLLSPFLSPSLSFAASSSQCPGRSAPQSEVRDESGQRNKGSGQRNRGSGQRKKGAGKECILWEKVSFCGQRKFSDDITPEVILDIAQYCQMAKITQYYPILLILLHITC